MKLSIIIPSYNRADLLRACLQSVVRHAPAQTQIIVVDDASPGGSVRQVAQVYPVELVIMRKRSGFCAAINAGLRRAKAPIVQTLNDDTEVQPHWAEVPCQRLIHESSLGSVAPLVLRWPDGRSIDSAGDDYDRGGFARSRGKGELLSVDYLRSQEVFSAPGCGAFYHRDRLREIGGFPESYGAYFDDLLVGARLRNRGYRCWYEPESRILHHGSASHGRVHGRRMTEQLARNEERLFWHQFAHAPNPATLVRHAAVLAAKATRRWRDGMLAPFLTGRLRAWLENLQPPAIATLRRSSLN